MKLVSPLSAKFAILVLSITLSLHGYAQRRGLAKQYSIPALEDSHIITGQTYETELNPHSIKVLVWNLLKAERKMWSRDFMKLSEKKDILLLQEGYLNPVMESTFDQMYQFRFDMGVSFLYNKDNYTPTGTILGSRISPVKTGILRTKNFEPFIKTPKMITYGVYPIRESSQTLLALTIHGMNFSQDKAFEDQIVDALKVIDQHQGPVIFAGDFNTRNKSRLSFLRKKMGARGLKEVTYLNTQKRMNFLGNYLDHTFARGLLVRDSKVVVDVDSSDHKALDMEFALDSAQ
jgi:endonuclease/exonuclease/phosphatase (EEP) superfamily protein YafD